MKHTECKDCELSNSDCGHHFKMDGKINYDIASLGACDKYGDCMFFKSKAKPKGDLISREALKEALHNFFDGKVIDEPTYILRDVFCYIDNAPTIEPRIEYGTDGQPYRLFMSDGQVVPDTLQGWRYEERPQGDWIVGDVYPFKYFCKCSNCGNQYVTSVGGDVSIIDFNFCPNCGADMRKGEEE